jgi:glycosyltransferase involved in cell wall biosynthesis
VVPNGVDLRPFQEPVAPVNRSRFGFSDEDVVLVYVGRLGPEKNLQFLLRSFAGTSQAYDHARLLMIGGGPDRETLEDLSTHLGVRDKVCFTGMLPYEEVPAYMAAADAFVTASVTEVHPMTVIEAMAASLPVLGIQSPGVGDTILDGETGYLVSSQDLASFTAMMVRLVREDDQRRRMGESARKAADSYAIERTCGMMEERYHQVVELARARKKGLRARLLRWMDALKK